MQIIIDIPEDVYREIMAHNRERREGGKSAYYFEGLIQNGVPLPKGHGVLKDVTNLMRGLYTDMQTIEETFTSSDVYKMIDEECPTIIEADKEYEAKVITRGNCMMCGKELTEGLFFCKECGDKANSREARKNKMTKYNMNDYKRAFKIACELLNGNTLYGMDSERIFEVIMNKDGIVDNESYENYILSHMDELDHGQYISQVESEE